MFPNSQLNVPNLISSTSHLLNSNLKKTFFFSITIPSHMDPHRRSSKKESFKVWRLSQIEILKHHKTSHRGGRSSSASVIYESLPPSRNSLFQSLMRAKIQLTTKKSDNYREICKINTKCYFLEWTSLLNVGVCWSVFGSE